MRVRFLPAVGLSALALVTATTLGPAAGASHSGAGRSPLVSHHDTSVNGHRHQAAQQVGCRFSQTGYDTGKYIDSTFHYDHNPGLDDFSIDDEAVDDFQCNSKTPTVVVNTVTAWGDDNNYPFGGFYVTIYDWNDGTPVGAALCGGYGHYSTSYGPPGVFKYIITIPGGCTLTRHDRYWLDLQASDGCYSECSFWYWSMLISPHRSAPAYWRNPNGGWDRGCTTWGTLSDCYTKDSVAYDLAFAI